MTTTSSDGLYLDPDQQDLLLRALQSNSDSRLFTSPSVNQISKSMTQQTPQHGTPESMSSQYGNGTPPPTAALNGSFPDGTPLIGGDLDYADWDKDFEADGAWDYDFDSNFNGGDNSMSGTVYADTPGSMSNGGQDSEKRKSPPANDDGSPSADPHDTEPKRRGGFLPSCSFTYLFVSYIIWIFTVINIYTYLPKMFFVLSRLPSLLAVVSSFISAFSCLVMPCLLLLTTGSPVM